MRGFGFSNGKRNDRKSSKNRMNRKKTSGEKRNKEPKSSKYKSTDTSNELITSPGVNRRRKKEPHASDPSSGISASEKKKSIKGPGIHNNNHYYLYRIRGRHSWFTSSNADKMSDEELKEISRIPKKKAGSRYRLLNNHVEMIEHNSEAVFVSKTITRFKFDSSELLALYFENKSFKKVFDKENYIYVDGYFCLYSDEFIEYRKNKLHIKEDVKEIVTQYCISIKDKYEVRSDNNHTLISSVARSSSKKCSKIDHDSMKYYIDTDGPDSFLTYGEALTHYMNERGYDCDDMEALTNISSKSIERYCSDKNLPKLSYSVAICIALKLIPEKSFEMIRLSKNVIDFTTDIGKAYKYLLYVATTGKLTVQKCNLALVNHGFKPLTPME